MAEIEGEYCPNESSPEYQLVLRLVNGDRQDAYEVWNMYKGELPNTLELQKIRYDYEVARRLRVGTLNDAVEEIRRRGKGVLAAKKHGGRFYIKDKHPNAGVVYQAVKTVNRLLRKETFEIDHVNHKRHESGNEIRFLKVIGGQSVFKQVDYALKPVETLLSDKAIQVFQKAEKAGWTLEKTLAEIGGFGKRTGYKELFDPKELNKKVTVEDRERLATDIAANYSYAIEVNTATRKTGGEWSINPQKGFEYNGNFYIRRYEDNVPRENEFPIDNTEFNKIMRLASNDLGTKTINTDYYSYLTVPGGTNGSYIEANIETPMIIPSIQSHAQFKTENTIGWMRADEKQNYQEKDIDDLIEIMKKSGILEVNCG